eukprot:6272030-Amphidinium_carterae.1
MPCKCFAWPPPLSASELASPSNNLLTAALTPARGFSASKRLDKTAVTASSLATSGVSTSIGTSCKLGAEMACGTSGTNETRCFFSSCCTAGGGGGNGFDAGFGCLSLGTSALRFGLD